VDLIKSHGVEKNTAILGSVWDQLPDIYAVTDIYCTPSVMEGFGMSPQEAAATRVPAVSSNLVPYVTEYLLGEDVENLQYQQTAPTMQVGKGAIVIQADDVPGFARAFDLLLSDEVLRKKMGQSAYAITIPYFTWDHMVSRFLENIDS
jgi:glycosyltransferase involved in cell wall biosynthesis